MMIRINRILCPTDMSTDADQALGYALAVSQAYERETCHLLLCQGRGGRRRNFISKRGCDDTRIGNRLRPVARVELRNSSRGSMIKLLGPVAYANLDWEASDHRRRRRGRSDNSNCR